MAGSAINKRLNASTLVEVLVVLVIITLVVAIAATLYATIGGKRPDNLVNLHLELKSLAQETKRSMDYSPRQYDMGNGVQIDREVKPYGSDTLLMVLELKGTKRGTSETAVFREIIIKGQ